MKRLEHTATAGETALTTTALIGKTVLVVKKDGVSYTKILTTGSATEKHARYNSPSGSISYGLAAEGGEEVYILYQDT